MDFCNTTLLIGLAVEERTKSRNTFSLMALIGMGCYDKRRNLYHSWIMKKIPATLTVSGYIKLLSSVDFYADTLTDLPNIILNS